MDPLAKYRFDQNGKKRVMSYIKEGDGRSYRAEVALENGLKMRSQLKDWQKKLIDNGQVTHREWHHTGAAGMETKFYHPMDFYDKEGKPIELKPTSLKKVKINNKYWDREAINRFGKLAWRLKDYIIDVFQNENGMFFKDEEGKTPFKPSKHWEYVKEESSEKK